MVTEVSGTPSTGSGRALLYAAVARVSSVAPPDEQPPSPAARAAREAGARRGRAGVLAARVPRRVDERRRRAVRGVEPDGLHARRLSHIFA